MLPDRRLATSVFTSGRLFNEVRIVSEQAVIIRSEAILESLNLFVRVISDLRQQFFLCDFHLMCESHFYPGCHLLADIRMQLNAGGFAAYRKPGRSH